MTSPAPSPAGARPRDGWRQQAARVAIGVAAAALLFFLGWMMGRSPAAELERERNEVRALNAVLTAETAAYESAVALEARNFGTANEHLRTAAAALAVLPSDGDIPGFGTEAAAALGEVRATLGATDLNVAVDVESQRATVLRLAGQLDRIATASAATAPAATTPAAAAPATADTLR